MKYTSEYLIEKLKNQPGTGIDDEEALSEAAGKNDAETDLKLMPAFEELRLKIGRDMRLDHVMFLFGNGASIYAGSQSTMNFSLEEYANDKKFARIEKELRSICSSLDGIEEQLNALITMRSFFSIMRQSQVYSNLESLVTDLIDSIKSRLIDSYVKTIDYRNLTWHEVLLRKLRSYGSLAKTQIYTTNYDLAFEYTMDNLSIEYNDGFSGFVKRQFDPRTLVESGKPSLVKIHGSVNWVSEDRRIMAVQPKFKDGHIVIEQDDMKPVLIYPTSNKLHETYSTPYSELMRHMLDEMKSGSNAVFVIGYKYGDEHVNEILYKALENPRNIFYFFIFEKPEKCDFINKVCELVKNMPNINILFGKVLASFENFVNYILPSAAEKTDEEQVLELLQKAMLKNEQNR